MFSYPCLLGILAWSSRNFLVCFKSWSLYLRLNLAIEIECITVWNTNKTSFFKTIFKRIQKPLDSTLMSIFCINRVIRYTKRSLEKATTEWHPSSPSRSRARAGRQRTGDVVPQPNSFTDSRACVGCDGCAVVSVVFQTLDYTNQAIKLMLRFRRFPTTYYPIDWFIGEKCTKNNTISGTLRTYADNK